MVGVKTHHTKKRGIMGIKVYRQGDTHIENGIACEIKVVNHDLFNGEPEKGWYLRPEEAYGMQRDEEETKEEDHQEVDIEDRPKRTRKKRNNKQIQGV